MAWKGRKEAPTDYSQLVSTLNTSGLQKEKPHLYQVIWQLIQFAQRNKGVFENQINELDNSINIAGDNITNVNDNLQNATIWTRNDETLLLASSLMVLAGAGITLDYTVANKVTIRSSGGGVLPMVNGDEPPQLMSNGAGDLVIIAYDMDTP